MGFIVYFNDIKRQLELTLRAIWATEFRLLALSPLDSTADLSPKLEGLTLYLPSQFEAASQDAAYRHYLSSALHLAAHQIYSKPFNAKGLNNRQKVLVGMVEDARVEALAERHFPGVSRLFSEQFLVPTDFKTHFAQLAYQAASALLTGTVLPGDEGGLSTKVLNLFLQHDLENQAISRTIGLSLANDIGQLRISMNERSTFSLLDYRDDNACLWVKENPISLSQAEPEEVKEVHSSGISFEEDNNGASVATQQVGSDSTELAFQASDESVESLNFEPIPSDNVVFYPEWDYRIGRLKKDWCSVVESQIPAQDDAEEVIDKYSYLVKQLHKIISTFQFEHQRKKHQRDGVELDTDALVDYTVAFRSGSVESESQIYIDRTKQNNQAFSILVLLDLSQSMNQVLGDTRQSILDLTLDSTSVLSQLLTRLGHQFQVDGFNSDGRHQVNYYHLKSFDEAEFRNTKKVEAGLSTRLGAALRHAFHQVSNRKSAHQLILLITDGKPSDIDVLHDSRHLVEDAAYAVQEIESSGCKVFCLSLDKLADDYLLKIFRKNHYEVLDKPEKLPDILVKLYLKVFKSFLR